MLIKTSTASKLEWLLLGLGLHYIVVFQSLLFRVAGLKRLHLSRPGFASVKDALIDLMKKLLLTLILVLTPVLAFAEFKLEHLGLDDLSVEDFSWKNISDLEGWTPRYTYVVDDNLIGRTHYMGMSFFKRQGAAHEGITLRGGFGHFGEKINLSYTSGFSLMGVDMGLSYLILDKDNLRQHENEIEGLGLELGLRFWVVQLIALHMDETSYVSLGYGF
ncbi:MULTISPECIES: hypothetical protein [unclassified Oleiphilus]|jgi:hypothetical protein|nr:MULTISPECIES: hypothetical protein [unclassified Oleiphilus]KZY29879.1 hypothetical protein A3729_11695 [Oleiphilus sp. HI0043]KZY65662.1 hypothetical protein A3735_07855 [Oleiphilus sp. HI0061]KZY77555.1 hypothetical protein A3740_01345 [Oleiphilus sp. HI0068]KZY77572.1 hypothetical protein A3741_09340 [Oleiphilus sp. HI0069]KZY91392.1 hypothetical protein A3743_27085 [Oleiphilus sp. HI0072]KZZ08263.1 hypothetical protein A3749_14535 [Oleiphilus sp. HI0078]KZZ33110.1 hypothetical protein